MISTVIFHHRISSIYSNFTICELCFVSVKFIMAYFLNKRKKKVKCCISNCKSYEMDPDLLSHFTFPNDPLRCKIWVENCGLTNLKNIDATILNKKYRICSLHFENSMFKNDKHNRLKSDSIPKLFENKPPGGSIEVHDDNDLNKDCLPSCSISDDFSIYSTFAESLCQSIDVDTTKSTENQTPLSLSSRTPHKVAFSKQLFEEINKRKQLEPLVTSNIQGRICDICKEFIPHYMNHSNCSPRPKKRKLDMDISLEPLPNTEPRVDVEVVEVEPEILLKHYYNDPDLQAKLIQAVKARPPLWNYKIKLKDRSENIKKILWDEIFVEMGGVVTVDELQAKWTYLKEKYCREKKKSRSETGLRQQWAHFNSLAFLEVIRNPFEKSPNISLDKPTTDIKNKPNVLAKTKTNRKSPEQTRSPKLILPSILLDDNDMAFSKYLCSILKDVPKKKKRKIQADIIFKIIKEIDNDNK